MGSAASRAHGLTLVCCWRSCPSIGLRLPRTIPPLACLLGSAWGRGPPELAHTHTRAHTQTHAYINMTPTHVCACWLQGRVVVPLREVQRRRRIRGKWPLQDAPHAEGALLMELSWIGAAGMW